MREKETKRAENYKIKALGGIITSVHGFKYQPIPMYIGQY